MNDLGGEAGLAEWAEKYNFWLRRLKPGEVYPYEFIPGRLRVPMFSVGLLHAVEFAPPTFTLTDLGEAAVLRSLASKEEK